MTNRTKRSLQLCVFDDGFIQKGTETQQPTINYIHTKAATEYRYISNPAAEINADVL